jgi:hypothetical protein
MHWIISCCYNNYSGFRIKILSIYIHINIHTYIHTYIHIYIYKHKNISFVYNIFLDLIKKHPNAVIDINMLNNQTIETNMKIQKYDVVESNKIIILKQIIKPIKPIKQIKQIKPIKPIKQIKPIKPKKLIKPKQTNNLEQIDQCNEIRENILTIMGGLFCFGLLITLLIVSFIY